MAIQPLRGFRDFYPEDQARINYLRSKIAAVCDLFGYEEFEGPAIESFDLYAAKSSDEIVNEQAFTFEDRGGEKIALRPELTPTLARMVANKQQELVFPLRWWSFGRFWRYERPQKGRGREFYQWNCDLLGDDSINAEIEILSITVAFLQSLGLTKDDVVIEVSDRAFISEQLALVGIPGAQWGNVFKYLDRMAKLNSEEQAAFANELGIDREKVSDLFSSADLWQQSPRLSEIVNAPQLTGWVEPNLSIVRGFNYYTGVVFEVSDRAKQYRAMIGGGRYDNLVATVGGQPVSGIGFGMGDMVLALFLKENGKLPGYAPVARACVIPIDSSVSAYAQEVAATLRENGINTVTAPDSLGFSKGMKLATRKQIPYALLIGNDEATNQTVTVKNLTTGDQQTVGIKEVSNLLK